MLFGVDRRAALPGRPELPRAKDSHVRRTHGGPRFVGTDPGLASAQGPKQRGSRGAVRVGDQQHRHVLLLQLGEFVLGPKRARIQ